jgi:hypothetical protein
MLLKQQCRQSFALRNARVALEAGGGVDELGWLARYYPPPRCEA